MGKAQQISIGCLIIMILVILSATTVRAVDTPVLVCDLWPPYQMKARGKVTGFSVDVVQTIYNRMGFPMASPVDYPWKRAIYLLKRGEADALFSANHAPEREEYAYYPEEPLTDTPWCIWSKAGSGIETLDDLKGKSVGVVIGYSYTPEFWKFIRNYCDVQEVHSDEINFKKLSLGRIDATIADFGNGHFLATSLNDRTLRPHKNITIKRTGLYVIFSRASTSEDFVQRFSDVLKEFKETEEYKELQVRYFGALP